MAAPVILPYQSVLGTPQGRAYEFQPYATNSPTGWALVPGSSLPPGLTLDATTGRLKGPVTSPGVYNFGLIAHNFDGDSAPLVFTMGVVAGPVELPVDILEVNVDIPSRMVTMGQDTKLAAYASTNPKRPAPILFAKRGDVVLMRVRFWRGQTIVDVPATDLKFAVKNLEPESTLVESSDWVRTAVPASGDIFYSLRVPFDKPELAAALADEEGDDSTFFIGLCEIAWEFTNVTPPVIGDGHCRTSSQTFGIALPRDIILDETS